MRAVGARAAAAGSWPGMLWLKFFFLTLLLYMGGFCAKCDTTCW